MNELETLKRQLPRLRDEREDAAKTVIRLREGCDNEADPERLQELARTLKDADLARCVAEARLEQIHRRIGLLESAWAGVAI